MVQDNPALETALTAGKLQFSRGKYQTLIVFLVTVDSKKVFLRFASSKYSRG